MRFSHYWKQISFVLIVGLMAATVGCNSGGEGETDADPGTPPSEGTSSESNGTSSNQAPNVIPTGLASEQPQADPLHPVVMIRTSMGDISVKLNAESANLTVANFLGYVNEGHYDKTIFHQVIKNSVMLGGAFLADFKEKPVNRQSVVPIMNQANNGMKNLYGTIAMAREPDVKDSATYQFFINLADNPRLDYAGESPEEYGYCVFGKVIEGMDVIEKIANTPVKNAEQFEQTPVETVMIESIQQVR